VETPEIPVVGTWMKSGAGILQPFQCKSFISSSLVKRPEHVSGAPHHTDLLIRPIESLESTRFSTDALVGLREFAKEKREASSRLPLLNFVT
jgi:hypothetical protein